jgi:hypothetical protein
MHEQSIFVFGIGFVLLAAAYVFARGRFQLLENHNPGTARFRPAAP